MAGRFDCVLVFHSSRFARNTIEAKRYKKLLREELGIDVVSVTQPLGGNADDPAAFLAESGCNYAVRIASESPEIAAWAAARRAIGTRYGEHET